MQVTRAIENDAPVWDNFVSTHRLCVNYHRWAWKKIIEQVFGWRTLYLAANEGGVTSGILPLVHMKSRLFGNLLCSLPFFSEAGIVADSPEASEALLAESLRIARDANATYVEIRHRGESPIPWPAKTTKVTLECDIHAEDEQNILRLSTKMRTNVRRSLKSGLEVRFGREELLREFYKIFCFKMRELGTPVYSRKFFEEILRQFPNEAFICCVFHKTKAIAAGFMTMWHGTIEANWSAALPSAMNLRPNMFLFWQMLCFGGRNGCRVFDFGRSSVGSGTYEFKQQWGTRVVPLYWNYWSASGASVMELNPENSRYNMAIKAWRRLPIFLTRWLGPPIARCLP